MNAILVVNHERDWPGEVRGVSVVSARRYLTDPAYSENHHRVRVFNLCRTDCYQGRGYYVSLLAEARGHRPMPEAKTIGDLQADQLGNLMSGGFKEQVQRALVSFAEDTVVLEAYFGRDPLRMNDSLSQQLFAVLRAPLVRASFARRNGEWQLSEARLLSASDIAPEHRLFVVKAATEFIARSRARMRGATQSSPSLAILYNQDEPNPPSNPQALERFCSVSQQLGMRTDFLRRTDIDRVSEFDALFIRDTTSVSNYTYQFARRAAAEGLVVVDDPESILKCTNKVYLNELLGRHRVPTPKTLMVHRDNVDQIVPLLGLPCVLKQPDSAFSLGVSKIHSREELYDCIDELFAKSDLLIAQEWLPTAFDWRVGVYDRRPLYVCKYFMAPGHWQVIKREAGREFEGLTKAMAVGEAPEIVVKTAVRAANLIGDGFYGVDLKESNDHCYVMEVNDNPNVDAGNEDGVLENALYRELMGVFLRRIQERKRVVGP
jgi:glutathione synthase/RimK-type ligase-like ATP-grasp enzyme